MDRIGRKEIIAALIDTYATITQGTNQLCL